MNADQIWEKVLETNPDYINWYQQIPNQYGSGYVNYGNSVEVDCPKSRNLVKYNCQETFVKISFPNVFSSFENANNIIDSSFKEIIAKIKNEMNVHDKVRIMFNHPSFDNPIKFPFILKSDLKIDYILGKFLQQVQSYRENDISELTGGYVIASLPSGSGFQNIDYNSSDDYLTNQKNVFHIINKDNYCALRAIIMGRAFLEEKKQLKTRHYVDSLKKKNSILLNKLVEKYAKKLKLKDEPLGITQIKKIQLYKEFRNYQITVYEDNILKDKKCRPYFIGPYQPNQIYLVYSKSHYNVIKKIKAFLNVDYYCHYCKVGYNNVNDHKCIATCILCKQQTCLLEFDTEDDITCLFCSKKCKSLSCRIRHEEYICPYRKSCNVCKQIKKYYHVCGTNSKWCTNCKASVDFDHKCFVLKDMLSTKSNNKYLG